jgi:hypothetical protein
LITPPLAATLQRCLPLMRRRAVLPLSAELIRHDAFAFIVFFLRHIMPIFTFSSISFTFSADIYFATLSPFSMPLRRCYAFAPVSFIFIFIDDADAADFLRFTFRHYFGCFQPLLPTLRRYCISSISPIFAFSFH